MGLYPKGSLLLERFVSWEKGKRFQTRCWLNVIYFIAIQYYHTLADEVFYFPWCLTTCSDSGSEKGLYDDKKRWGQRDVFIKENRFQPGCLTTSGSFPGRYFFLCLEQMDIFTSRSTYNQEESHPGAPITRRNHIQEHL